MDREIPKKEKQKKLLMRIGKIAGSLVLLTIIIVSGINYARSTVNKKSLTFSKVDKGTIETSVTASGEVYPAFEEIINSPISSRIVEVYCHNAAIHIHIGLMSKYVQAALGYKLCYQRKLSCLGLRLLQKLFAPVSQKRCRGFAFQIGL